MGLKFRSMILMILGSQKLWQGGNSPLYCRGKPHTALRIHPYAQTRGVSGVDRLRCHRAKAEK